MLMAFGGQTNSQSWHETHLVRSGILHQIGGATIAFGHGPFLLRVLHGDLLLEEVGERYLEAIDQRRDVKLFVPLERGSFDNHGQPSYRCCIQRMMAVMIMLARARGRKRFQPRSMS